MREIFIDPEDWPRCEVCDMPVEKFCVTDTGNALVLVAACHEKVETVTVPDTVWEQYGPSGEIGPAFAKGDH